MLPVGQSEQKTLTSDAIQRKVGHGPVSWKLHLKKKIHATRGGMSSQDANACPLHTMSTKVNSPNSDWLLQGKMLLEQFSGRLTQKRI